MALSIVTLNANGLRDQSKRAGLLQWFTSLTVVPDIVCLQECHCSSDLECQTWFRASGYLCALAAWSTHARGCIFFFGQLCLLYSLGLNLMEDFRCVNFVFVTKFFVSAVFLLLIVTHKVISSLTMFLSGLIRLSVLCLLVISTPFPTGLLIVVDRIPLMYLVNHLVL